MPLGGMNAIGPYFKHRKIHFLLMTSWTIEQEGSSERLSNDIATYLAAHPNHQLTFLGNTEREVELMRGKGYPVALINQNCFMNEEMFKPIPGVEPIYDAVYNARLSRDKRQELASEIDRLALVYYYFSGDGTVAEFHARHAALAAMIPSVNLVNKLTPEGCEYISHEEINLLLAQSKIGLCLSSVEGAMRASMEYMLAGLSVVSTPSLGGRDYFFADDYCIICPPDPRSVREAVDALIARNIPRDYVRQKTLARVNAERQRYIALVQDLIDRGRGKTRFADRFETVTRGKTIYNWRDMDEFRKIVRWQGFQKLRFW